MPTAITVHPVGGAVCSTLGRLVLAWAAGRWGRKIVPAKKRTEIDALGAWLDNRPSWQVPHPQLCSSLGGTMRSLPRHMIARGTEEVQDMFAMASKPVVDMRIGYQGMPGAYSEEALVSFLPNAEAAPKRTLQDVFAALDSGEIDRAFVPVENSHAGSVVETYDLMLDHAVTVTAERIHQVHHCLLGLPGSDLSQVERVFSHPQALAQTTAYLQRLDVEIEPFYDTAGAAEMVAARNDPRCAAVASQLAGHRYGLQILASTIETSADNATRFFLLAPGAWTEHRTVRGEGVGKTSLVFAVEHQPGALVRALSSFSRRQVNLARLESRPSRRKPWEYLFFTDADGYTDDPQLHAALEDLGHLSSLVQVLGSYPAALVEGEGATTER